MFEGLLKRLFGRRKEIRVAEQAVSELRPWDCQYPGNEGKAPRFVVVGLDFGTAFTKVVISSKEDSFAIPLRPERQGIDAYLLPGLLERRADGTYEIATSPDAPGLVGNLKLALIEQPSQVKARAHAAILLAMVLQQARAWFMTHYQGVFGNNVLDWHLNIGLPGEDIEDKALVDAFGVVARAAWTLSLLEGRHTDDLVRGVLDAQAASSAKSETIPEMMRARLMHPDKASVVPEVLAETVSYSRSPLRSDGLHLLVDIGAATLDINAFMLSKYDGEDRSALLYARVFPLGSVYLARHRLGRLQKRGLVAGKDVTRLCNEYRSLPSREDLENEAGVAPGTVEEIDRAFLDQVGGTIWDVINKTRKEIYFGAPEWAQGLTTFLAGGGSQEAAYRERMERLSRDMRGNGMGGLLLRPFPRPDRLQIDGVPDNQFHRLAVAYGLAQDPLDLGEFISSGKIAPCERAQAVDMGNRFRAKEMT